jgi:hypothetical protein
MLGVSTDPLGLVYFVWQQQTLPDLDLTYEIFSLSPLDLLYLLFLWQMIEILAFYQNQRCIDMYYLMSLNIRNLNEI